MFAEDLMTIDVACVNVEASLERAIRLMLDRNVSGLPVLDDAGDVCGIITEGDLLNRHDSVRVEKRTYHKRMLRSSKPMSNNMGKRSRIA